MADVSLSVRHYMSNRLATLYEKQGICEAVKIFTEHYRRYPVVDDNRVVGVITRLDVRKAVISNLSKSTYS